jgi:drug/metabolite transporter (DMT)-like permease
MSRRGLTLFLLVGLLWGIPYLFIKVAVDKETGFPPAIVVFGRVLIGAAILLPIAIKDGSLAKAIKGAKYVAFYALLEMIAPWILIGTAEQSIPSGLAGLLVASVPIWSAIITSFHGDKSVWHYKRLLGMLVGFVGVILVVGIESITGSSSPLAIAMMLAASMLYAYAIIMIRRALPNDSGIAINGLAMAISALFYLPFTIALWPSHHVEANAIYSVVALGVLSTGAAFAIFFAVVKDIGPARASFVTYLNTAFAVLLGLVILNEPLTPGIVIGLPLILIGSYFASRKTADA